MLMQNRYKRWLNQEQFVFIQIWRNLTNQHNFCFFLASFHNHLYSSRDALGNARKTLLLCARLFYGTFLEIFFLNPHHIILCVYTCWMVFMVTIQNFSHFCLVYFIYAELHRALLKFKLIFFLIKLHEYENFYSLVKLFVKFTNHKLLKRF